ncbi:MAG: hypothetical protein OEM02_00735 [Desulfobulbaceae bacterium]|nr:hypothetical protein [Desulfobulbaceae bacterium]
MKICTWCSILLITAFSLAGCFSLQQVRDRRIVNNQLLFNTFSPEVQEKVRQGNIDIGFSEHMVGIAWGSPSRIFNRTTKEGVTIIWEYTRTETFFHPHSMGFPIYMVDRYGKGRTVYHGVWLDHENGVEYVTARVEFSKGVVSAVERLRQ